MNYTEYICRIIENFKKMLLEKNRRYGNSGIQPINIFCAEGEHKGLESRIDDKLMRIKTSTNSGEPIRFNDVADLMGYLVLLCVRNKWDKFEELID